MYLYVPGGEYLCEVGVDLWHAGHPLADLHVDAHVRKHADDLDHNILHNISMFFQTYKYSLFCIYFFKLINIPFFVYIFFKLINLPFSVYIFFKLINIPFFVYIFLFMGYLYVLFLKK